MRTALTVLSLCPLFCCLPVAAQQIAPAALDSLLRKNLERLPHAGSITLSYADVVAEAQPGVVTVLVSRAPLVPPTKPTPNNDLDLGSGESQEDADPPEDRSSGSGVILTTQGHLLTNHHVVKGATHIKVRLPGDVRDLEATLIGSDATTDVALLKVNAPDLKPITITDSSVLRAGDVVLALGSPFGLEQTVTLGIVSATGRAMRFGDTGQEDYIQTDAPINPGNSGGALLDGRGRLVGINTAVYYDNYHRANGIGFAVPTNLALRVAGDLLSHGYFVRGFLGARMVPVSKAEALAITGREDLTPAKVFAIEKGSPADLGGFAKGDIIKALNGTPMPSINRLRYGIAVSKPDTKATFTVLRDGKTLPLEVTLTQAPRTPGYDLVSEDELNGGFITLQDGLQIAPLTEEARSKAGVPKNVIGVLITRAEVNGKPMATLQPGDILRELGGQPVPTPPDARKVFARAAPGQLLMARLWSGGREIFIKLKKN